MVFSVVSPGEAAKVVPRPKQEARKISAMLIAALTRNLSIAFLPVVFTLETAPANSRSLVERNCSAVLHIINTGGCDLKGKPT